MTIIDAGLPGYYGDIDRELAAMGRAPADVRALVLTHGHSDHIGFAERLRRERAVPVSVHEADAALARGEVSNPSKGFGPVKLGLLLGFLRFSVLHGGLRTPRLQQVPPPAFIALPFAGIRGPCRLAAGHAAARTNRSRPAVSPSRSSTPRSTTACCALHCYQPATRPPVIAAPLRIIDPHVDNRLADGGCRRRSQANPDSLRDRPEPKTAQTAVRSSDRRIASRSRSAARARPAPPLAFPGPRPASAGSATRRARRALAAAGPVSGRRTRRRSRPRTAPR